VNATCPLDQLQSFAREISLQFGEKIEDTRTMLHAAIPAFRNASSKLESSRDVFLRPWSGKSFCDKRNSAGSPSMSDFLKNFFYVLWKSNKVSL